VSVNNSLLKAKEKWLNHVLKMKISILGTAYNIIWI